MLFCLCLLLTFYVKPHRKARLMLSRAKLNIKWLLWWTDRVRDEENVQSNEYSRAMRTWCLCQERKCVCTKNKPIREQSEVKFLLWKRENIDLLRTRSTNDISRDVINWIVDIFNGKVMDWSKYLFIYVKNIFVQFCSTMACYKSCAIEIPRDESEKWKLCP